MNGTERTINKQKNKEKEAILKQYIYLSKKIIKRLNSRMFLIEYFRHKKCYNLPGRLLSSKS
jgi:hypothetical protein